MKLKLNIIFSLLGFIFLTSFISAQGELSEVIGEIDGDVLVLIAIFMIAFSFIFFALKKTLFKEDLTVSGIIAGMLALLITYSVNKSGTDGLGFENTLGNIGLSSSSFSLIIFLFGVAGIVYLVIRFARESLLIIGGLLLLLGFLSYEKALLITLGCILIIVRLFVFTGKNKDKWKPKPKSP